LFEKGQLLKQLAFLFSCPLFIYKILYGFFELINPFKISDTFPTTDCKNKKVILFFGQTKNSICSILN